jgi:RNA polymerase sigma factor (sigma-70 family)
MGMKSPYNPFRVKQNLPFYSILFNVFTDRSKLVESFTKTFKQMKAADLTGEIIKMSPHLKRFTYRFTGDREESNDLLQDTLLKALKYQHRFTEQTNLKGWLFTIMRNTFINGYRKSKKSRTILDNTKDSWQLNISDNHTFHSPHQNFEYEDLWKNVHQLKDELLVPFKMHVSGYKYHEIADHLSIPVGTVKNRIFHARKEIQKKLAGYC